MLKMRGFSVKGINKKPLNLLKLSEIVYFLGKVSLKACSGGYFMTKLSVYKFNYPSPENLSFTSRSAVQLDFLPSPARGTTVQIKF